MSQDRRRVYAAFREYERMKEGRGSWDGADRVMQLLQQIMKAGLVDPDL